MSAEVDNYPPSHEEIMWATHEAISKYGYANLTLRKIAAESSKSHSLLTYHYDTKADLVLLYFEFLIDLLEEYIQEDFPAHPIDQVEEFLEYFTVGSEVLPRDLQVAFLELQMAALRDENVRRKHAERLRDNVRLLSEIIEDGIERGVFRPDIDPDAISKLLLSSMIGASDQETIADEDITTAVRESLRSVVFPYLLVRDDHVCEDSEGSRS